jgi:hypothetical protein
VTAIFVSVELLNVPAHPRARIDLFETLHGRMREHGYVRDPAEPVALARVEYVNQSEDDGKPTCQIAADIKAIVSAIHTPSKVLVRRSGDSFA